MKSFSEFAPVYEAKFEDVSKEVVFCWGRFNPPTRAHQMVFQTAKAEAEDRNAAFYIFTSQTADDDKNPLDFSTKIITLERYFPELSVHIVKNKDIRTLFDVVRKLQENDFTDLTLFVGSDRQRIFQEQLRTYFDDLTINVETAGKERDENEAGMEGLSGQKLRDFVRAGDYRSFLKSSPKNVSEEYVEDTFHAIRRRYGLPTEGPKRETVEISTSDEREKFFNGYFKEGDRILKNATNQIGEVKSVGSNYLNILLLGETKQRREWPWEVTKL